MPSTIRKQQQRNLVRFHLYTSVCRKTKERFFFATLFFVIIFLLVSADDVMAEKSVVSKRIFSFDILILMGLVIFFSTCNYLFSYDIVNREQFYVESALGLQHSK